MDLKSSPLSKTPTGSKLPIIPGVTLDDDGKIIEEDEESLNEANGTIPEETTKPARNDEKKSNGKYFFQRSKYPTNLKYPTNFSEYKI